MVIGQTKRLNRAARIDGGLEKRWTEPTSINAAVRRPFRKRDHGMAVEEAPEYGVDDRGQLPKAAPFDGDDMSQPSREPHSRPLDEIGAGHECTRQD